MNANPRPVGPASQIYYRVTDSVLRTDQHMDFPASFRRELSAAFSAFYFLHPHAIVLSQIENRPLSDYLDMQAYDRASLLYGQVGSAVQDQQRSLQSVSRGWRLTLRDLGHVIR